MSQLLSRRMMLGGTLGGFFALAMRRRAEGALAQTPTGKAKRCLVLWMNGGPSQFETFDPKPGTNTGGGARSIETSVPGMSICDTLPHIARRMDRLSIVRNLTSIEGDHERGYYTMHTGYSFVPAFPRPALGAVVSHESPVADFPHYVTIGSTGLGPAFLGPDHAPFSIEDPQTALALLQKVGRRRKRIQLLEELGEPFDRSHPTATLERRRKLIGRIESLVNTSFVSALDVGREPESVRSRYGDQPFGRACLVARRLLESGVNYVEVHHDNWDTHQNNAAMTRELCAAIDEPWALLMDDLAASGLLDETIVLWMGEFGRTPQINATSGRDHFPQVTPAVLGGGGLKGGVVVGATSESGTEVAGEPYRVADLFATVFQALGIDPAREFQTSFGSPTTATEQGRPIQELA